MSQAPRPGFEPSLTSPAAADVDLVRSYAVTPRPAPRPGFVTDFLGVHTRTRYIHSLAPHAAAGLVEDAPVPGNFHATTLEWAGLIHAVAAAAGRFVAVELGAGWGPWLVAGAVLAGRRGVGVVRLCGVEGSAEHVAYMREHLADNGLAAADHRLVHGVVGEADGVADFPRLDRPDLQWGAQAVLPRAGPGGVRRLPRRVAKTVHRRLFGPRPVADGFERLACYSVPTILADYDRVDLLHVDIQGSEVEVLRAARPVLRDKVRRVIVGTHTRCIEQALHDEFNRDGWALEGDEACKVGQDANGVVLRLDGCQVWRNDRV